MKVGDDLSATQDSEGVPLHGVNRFDKVVRHEIGHAVDAQIGFMDSYGSKTHFGGWEKYGSDWEQVLDIIIAEHGLPEGVTTARAELENAMRAGTRSNKWSEFMRFILSEELEDHPAVECIKAGLDGSPWYNADPGALVGGRRYVLSYKNNWTSFQASTHAQKVSKYQFRAPGEWFAEAYAAYYDPASNGDGELLKQVNPKAKTEFDTKVDTITPASTTEPKQGDE